MIRIKIALLAGIAVNAAVFGVHPATAADEEGTSAAQRARGAQAWQQQCGRCHNLRSPNEKQDYEWDISVNHMRIIGNIPGQTAEDIKAFLKSSN